MTSEDQGWRKHAVCLSVGTHAFFPEVGEPSKAAKAVCNGRRGSPPCPVRDACLTYALNHDERYGVWGGTSEKERAILKNRLAGTTSHRVRKKP